MCDVVIVLVFKDLNKSLDTLFSREIGDKKFLFRITQMAGWVYTPRSLWFYYLFSFHSLALGVSIFKVFISVLHMLNKIIMSDFRVQVLFTTFVQIHHEGAEWEDSITISKENFLIPVLPLSSTMLQTSILHLSLYFQRPPLFHQMTCVRSTIVAGCIAFL